MKEICGYKDLYGSFHEKEIDCKLADARYKIKEISSKLDNFEHEINSLMWKKKEQFYYISKDRYSERLEDSILRYVSNIILSNTKEFQEVIKKAENFHNELDLLYEHQARLKEEKWWLRFKWWKQ